VASQLILVVVGSGTRKMFMPEQKLHSHEEVFKDHVTGQHDETIFRFRVPGGWIYTHTVIRFGSVDKNFVADTFVPDSKDGLVTEQSSELREPNRASLDAKRDRY